MQDATRAAIRPNVFLTYVSTGKFKVNTISVNLLCPLNPETASKNALIPRVLRRGTISLPDMKSISEYLDELYGARIEPTVRKKGEVQSVGFFADFIDDRLIPGGGGILEKVVSLLGELLLSPNTSGGLLRAEYVESEKANLADEINALVNEKRSYSMNRLIELMCPGETFRVHKLGDAVRAQTITPLSLTKHYREMLASSVIEIVYCGGADRMRLENALKQAFSTLIRTDASVDLSTDVRIEPVESEKRQFTERLDVGQGKLVIGFRVGEAMKRPNYAELAVFNAVFGGSVTSKLFLNVREKLSLCYYASSVIEKHKGVMLVASGVEFEKFDEALDEILRQLEDVKSGEITDFELEAARLASANGILTALDTPSGMEELYFDAVFGENKYAPEELAAGCLEISREAVASVASGVRLDAVYYLTGTGGDIFGKEVI